MVARSLAPVLTTSARPGDDDLEGVRQVLLSMKQTDGALDLGELLNRIPAARQSPVVLDMLVEAVLSDLVLSGASVADASDMLCTNYPGCSGAVQLAACLAVVFDSTLAPVTTLPEVAVGTRLGAPVTDGQPRYEVTGGIGRGSNGVVYSATDHGLSREGHRESVAIKVLRRRDGAASDSAIEASRLASARHPNVVAVRDAGHVGHELDYIAMELVEAGCLWDYRDCGRREIVRMMRDVSAGVHAIHMRGIVHGDLKPSNILVHLPEGAATRPVPKVSDFGASRRLQVGRSAECSDSTVEAAAGNLAFMAPEVWAGHAPGIQSDVYALAAITSYLLSGDLEHTEQGASNGIAQGTGTKVRGRLSRMLKAATASDVTQRPASAAEFAGWLDAWLTSRPVPELDSIGVRARLYVRRRPAIATAVGLIAIAGALAAVSYQRAREGFAYRNGMVSAAAGVREWHQRANPAFSDRASVFDLASRSALRRLVRDSEALNWVLADELDLEQQIASTATLLSVATAESTDSLLLRERLIFLKLQSRERHDDTMSLIGQQRLALDQAGLLVPEDEQQLMVFASVADVKQAAISGQWSTDQMRTAAETLEAFLKAQPRSTAARMDSGPRRDPRVRLAARALDWVSSPAILDDADMYAWIGLEYGEGE